MNDSNNNIKISVSARRLAEIVHRSGGLAQSAYGGVDSIDGIRAHQRFIETIKQTQPMFYHASECPFSLEEKFTDFQINIRGRLDHLTFFENQLILYEGKSFRGNKLYLPKDGEPVHWAQLYIYAYMLKKLTYEDLAKTLKSNDACITKEIHNAISSESLNLALVYIAVDSEDIVYKKRTVSFKEINDFFELTVKKYYTKMQGWLSWKEIRNTSIQQTGFPFNSLRDGQKQMMREVLGIMRDKGSLLAQAPTGIGKTMGTLFPALKALSANYIQKVFYATAMIATRDVAANSLKILRNNGMAIRSIVLSSKEKSCLQPDLFCDQTICPFAVDYYERLPDAMQDLFKYQDITPDIVSQIATKHQVCPHELSLDISDFCDVVIGDYNHVFDPQASIKRIIRSQDEICGLLIDEAHNLPSRAREMFSAQISEESIKDAIEILRFPSLNFLPKYNDLLESFHQILMFFDEILLVFENNQKPKQNSFFLPSEEKWLIDDNFIGVKSKPIPFLKLINRTIELTRYFLDDQKMFDGRQTILKAWFDLMYFVRIADFYYDKAYLTVFRADNKKQISCYLLALDAARHITDVYQNKHPIIFFSATMSPLHYYHSLLNSKFKEFPSEVLSLDSPFEPSNRFLSSAINFSVKYKDREKSMPYILRLILRICKKKQGNYLIFVPSFQYLEQLKKMLRKYKASENEHLVYQDRNMTHKMKQDFLSHYENFGEHTLIGFAVLGSHFNEGIDLEGEKLSGVFVIGTGIPQISPERELMTQYYAEHFEGGRAFGYQYPGFNRVQQAIGRLIRSESDTGIAILIDDRYANPEWNTIFPNDWHVKNYLDPDDLVNDIEIFWEDHQL